ncbi:MAG TPA: CotH kinase family protein, partial [Kofleriaceae bacterium]|nr:CotH kinase family protein [Kofleriaceae bacterium]
ARQFVASIPAVAEGVVVRYRVRADRGAGGEVISPRATDPYRWHAYAKTPAVATTTRTYHLQIAPAAWGQLWTNLQGGRDTGCDVNPRWDDEAPAFLLHGDKVYDVRVRYQGSRFNRTLGLDLPSWPYPGPTTGPIRALSWHISFPRYRRLEGREKIILNKNWQSCPGYDLGVGYRLFRDAGIPAPETRYARLHINGGYFHYMLEVERPGDDMMAKVGPVGELFKAVGGGSESGAYGVADERRIGPACGLSARERYAMTYDRKTHNSWGNADSVMTLVEELNDARAAGVAAEREFFARNFDLERLLDYMAIINWSVPFDDYIHNHYLYRRRDGRWIMMPWDLDKNFGSWRPADSSIYLGAEGEADAIGGRWNHLKDSFLRAYRAEFHARLLQFIDGPLSPAVVHPKVDAWMATGNLAEAMAAPAGMNCSGFAGRAGSWKEFVTERAAAVRARLP